MATINIVNKQEKPTFVCIQGSVLLYIDSPQTHHVPSEHLQEIWVFERHTRFSFHTAEGSINIFLLLLPLQKILEICGRLYAQDFF